MKTKRILTAMVLMMAVATSGLAKAVATDCAAGDNERKTSTVYLTKKGKTYHKASCRKLRSRKLVSMKRGAADAQGLKPCKKCHK